MNSPTIEPIPVVVATFGQGPCQYVRLSPKTRRLQRSKRPKLRLVE